MYYHCYDITKNADKAIELVNDKSLVIDPWFLQACCAAGEDHKSLPYSHHLIEGLRKAELVEIGTAICMQNLAIAPAAKYPPANHKSAYDYRYGEAGLLRMKT